MKIRKKELFLILGIFVLVILSASFAKYVGYSIQTTFSEVSIDIGVKVYASEFDGSTSDFLRMSDSELGAIENMTLENYRHGKIVFSGSVDLIQDVVDNIVDLDGGVEISNNFIDVNLTALTSLSGPATLYLHGLTFGNPRILRNGEVCPSSICEEVSYSGGILEFTTTSFSNYSAENVPVEKESPRFPGSSGGGDFEEGPKFSLDRDFIKVVITQGESKREVVKVTNEGSSELAFVVEYEELKDFVIIKEDLFVLEKGEPKLLDIDIFAKEDEVPDAYTGRIFVRGGDLEEAINVIVEVKGRAPLFDIRSEVTNKIVKQGREVRAYVFLVNFGNLRNIDVLLYLAIKDFEGNVITFKEESLAIDEKLDLVRGLRVPKDIEDGQYIFYSKVSYGDISAVSADAFEVRERGDVYTWVVVLILLALVAWIFVRGKKKRRK